MWDAPEGRDAQKVDACGAEVGTIRPRLDKQTNYGCLPTYIPPTAVPDLYTARRGPYAEGWSNADPAWHQPVPNGSVTNDASSCS